VEFCGDIEPVTLRMFRGSPDEFGDAFVFVGSTSLRHAVSSGSGKELVQARM
jgi:hypothetical protein